MKRKIGAEVQMGYEFECRHLFADCEGTVQAATEKELLEAVAGHASDVHNLDRLEPELLEQLMEAVVHTEA